MDSAEGGLRRLEEDLQPDEWKQRYSHLFHSESMDYGYRVVIAKSEAG